MLCLTVLTTLVIAVTRSVARRKLKLQIAELERNKALNEERLRISREMHDDIGAGLTQITLMSEAAKNPEKGVKPIEEIAGTSRKLISSINEIIWSLHPENQSLEQLLAYLREQLHQLLEYSGIEYSIRFPENGKHILLSNAQRRNLLLVTKEIVHNAIKHSRAKHIEVVCRITQSGIAFTISDDGIGIAASPESSGNGLRNIRKRIEELNGELLVQSEGGSGSRFFYTIPVSV
jgi:signal transduction histidine kinase